MVKRVKEKLKLLESEEVPSKQLILDAVELARNTEHSAEKILEILKITYIQYLERNIPKELQQGKLL